MRCSGLPSRLGDLEGLVLPLLLPPQQLADDAALPAERTAALLLLGRPPARSHEHVLQGVLAAGQLVLERDHLLAGLRRRLGPGRRVQPGVQQRYVVGYGEVEFADASRHEVFYLQQYTKILISIFEAIHDIGFVCQFWIYKY